MGDVPERTVISYEDKKKKKKGKAEQQKGDKGKPGFFTKLKKTLKHSGKEMSTASPSSSFPLPISQEISSDDKESQATLVIPPTKELTKTEEEAERDKMEFYRAIGYSEDDEGIQFPKEVGGLKFVQRLFSHFMISFSPSPPQFFVASMWLTRS